MLILGFGKFGPFGKSVYTTLKGATIYSFCGALCKLHEYDPTLKTTQPHSFWDGAR